jgi:hypothetical protein
MNIVTRVKEMLLAPQATWPVIEGEQTDTATLYAQYVMILAAIPAVAGFIGMSIFGVSGFGVSMRVPLMSGLVQMVLGYGLGLAMVYVLALIADFLAPKFGGQQNPMSALKLIAYSSTASMVGGIFALIPALGVLGLVASLYSLYTLYLGVPTLMKVPQEKSVVYTVVLVVCAIVVGVIMGTVLGAVRGGPTMGMSGGMHAPGPVSIETPKGTFKVEQAPGGGTVKMQTPDGAVTVDVAKAQAWGKRMEEASKKMQAAQQSGNQAEMEQAMKEMTALQAEQPMAKQ